MHTERAPLAQVQKVKHLQEQRLCDRVRVSPQHLSVYRLNCLLAPLSAIYANKMRHLTNAPISVNKNK